MLLLLFSFMLVLFPIVTYYIFIYIRRKTGFKLNINKHIICAAFFLCYGVVGLLVYYGKGVIYFLPYILPFVILSMTDMKETKITIVSAIKAILIIVTSTVWIIWNILKIRSGKWILFLKTDLDNRISIAIILLLAWCINLALIYFISSVADNIEQEDGEAKETISLKNVMSVILFLLFLAVACNRFFALLIVKAGYYADKTVMQTVIYYFTGGPQLVNVFLLICICFVFIGLLGRGIGGLFSVVLCLFLCGTNYIKIVYHDSFFSWLDLFQTKELFLIGKEFITPLILTFIILSVVALCAVIFVFRKRIAKALKPKILPVQLVAALVFSTFMIIGIDKTIFVDLNMYPYTWENVKVNVLNNGFVVNLWYDFKNVKNAKLKEPSDYSEEMAQNLNAEFMDLSDVRTETEEQPTVIVILAESLFDFDDMPGIVLSDDTDATLDKYSGTKLISPRFGGYTSAIEFEVLTGLTLALMPEGLTPYTTYFNNINDRFPSVPLCFKENGYITKAIHPNLAAFYNRDKVYEQLGFDEFISIVDFADCADDDMTVNGWVKDSVLGDKIIEQLQSSDTPQFIFAITMESHYVNQDKFDEPQIKVVANEFGLDEKEINELEQQAVAYKDTDEMIEKIIEYINTEDKPILLYVFGDHLPPLASFNKTGYLNDVYNKYTTRYLAYSNYKNIATEVEYITPNQIAAQVMIDSDVKHPAYFDYIFSLRNTMPVLHKEFIDMNSTDLETYKFIQYDIMFGDRYLYNCDWVK
ncbi:MAG: LTA synthase family protein [Clostridium sp.]|nr:LTA synthase family protein [Clostridium sp.]